MENKKLKLTVTGKPKKNLKNLTTPNTQSKRSVVIGKSQNRFDKKGSSFRQTKPSFANKISSKLPSEIKLHSLKLEETETSYSEWFAADN